MASNKQVSRPITGGRIEKGNIGNKSAVDAALMENHTLRAIESLNAFLNAKAEYDKVPQDLAMENKKLLEDTKSLREKYLKSLQDNQKLRENNKKLIEMNRSLSNLTRSLFTRAETAEKENERLKEVEKEHKMFKEQETLLQGLRQLKSDSQSQITSLKDQVANLSKALKVEKDTATEYTTTLEPVKKELLEANVVIKTECSEENN